MYYIATYYVLQYYYVTAQKMEFSIKDFFIKCDQIRRKLQIWSHLLKKSLMDNFIFCAVCSLATMKLQMNFPNSNNFHNLTLIPI